MLVRATNLKNKETNNIYNKKSFCTYHAPDWKERVTEWKQEKEKAVGPGDWDGTPNRAFGRDMEAGHATPQFLTSVRASPVPASQSAPAETTPELPESQKLPGFSYQLASVSKQIIHPLLDVFIPAMA